MNAKDLKKIELRKHEIWSDPNGRRVCMECMGMSMFGDITNNLRQGKTWNGGFRFTTAERADFRDFLINEIKTAPTCECGKVEF